MTTVKEDLSSNVNVSSLKFGQLSKGEKLVDRCGHIAVTANQNVC